MSERTIARDADMAAVMLEQARRLDGLYAGLCEPSEYAELVAAGLLRICYEGLGGFMGMRKLRATT